MSSTKPRTLEGNLVVPPGPRFYLVASRFNHFVVDRLVGAGWRGGRRRRPSPALIGIRHLLGRADRDRLAGPAAGPVDRLAVGDGGQPGGDVGAVAEVRVGPQSGEERVGPGVVGLVAAEHGATDPQHHRAVVDHDELERRQGHDGKTLGGPGT